MGFVIRWVFALFLVAATYNPSGWNYLRWAGANWQGNLPMVLLLGVLLVIGYGIYLRATLRSIGPVGIGLVLALIGALGWVLFDLGVLSLKDPGLNTWLAILALSLVLGIGLSWSIVRRALTGQADVDDPDNDL